MEKLKYCPIVDFKQSQIRLRICPKLSRLLRYGRQTSCVWHFWADMSARITVETSSGNCNLTVQRSGCTHTVAPAGGGRGRQISRSAHAASSSSSPPSPPAARPAHTNVSLHQSESQLTLNHCPPQPSRLGSNGGERVHSRVTFPPRGHVAV